MNSYENPELSYECDLTAERDSLKAINAELLAACKAAEKLAWEVGCETEDGVHTILEDSRGDLWRQLSAAIARATGRE